DEAPGVSGVETQFLGQPGRDGVELQTAVPGRVDATQLSGRHRGHEALCGSGRGAEIDEAAEQHTGVEKCRPAHRGQRARSSATSVEKSTRGSLPTDTVGRATRRLPTRTSLGPGTLRTRRTAPSSMLTSISVPGDRPARALIAAGMTTRPPRSMVVFIPSTYHIETILVAEADSSRVGPSPRRTSHPATAGLCKSSARTR